MKIKLFVTALTLFASLSINAQNLKMGYTNIEFILQNLPESKDIQSKITTEKAQYDKLYQDKLAEAQKLYEDYQKNQASMSAVIKADKEKSLTNKQNELQELQQNAEAALSRKQQELIAPIMDKIQTAIDAVAKENGYTYVLNSDAGYGTTPVILVAPESDNITNLVFKKMGVTPPAEVKEEPKK
ncbi:OmpH family outer membrane protein [Lacihabitans sp. LS3-19]|uniref:OmpH family outer membrane protein n=1 Tax=Lacihabitans sp. LS3-19 TaxID=2487335 RepID=UPI0020CE207C|nr:OmpH family outer membrane protein [Lacihabitans sp. LS3-19]MCP9769143.1 OmpH family outer membrane protein [Lacihabitans sp. LS3-19]